MDDFNGRYMVVNEAGKAVIYQRRYDEVLKRRRFDRLTVRDLQTLYLNKQVQVGVDQKGNPACKNVADLWLRHPDRRQYDPRRKSCDPDRARRRRMYSDLCRRLQRHPSTGRLEPDARAHSTIIWTAIRSGSTT